MPTKIKHISICLIIIIAMQIIPLNYLEFSWLFANASAADETRNMTYTGNYQAGYQAIYSDAKSTTTNPFSVTAPVGKVIKEIGFYMNGDTQPVMKIDSAVGLSSWSTVGINLTGDPVVVESIGNDSAQGYFAWYRYAPGTSGKTLDWYQDGALGCSDHSGRDYTENVNGSMMPKSPNCLGAGLSLTANRQVGYTTVSGTPIPSSVVNASDITATAQIFTDASVSGPAGVDDGVTVASKTHYIETKGITSDRYEVFYTQDLNYESDYTKQLGLPGAKVMVYYAAFKVNLKSKTYKYPDHIKITYETATGPPNLGNVILDEEGQCIEVNKSTNFHFSFTNTGGTNVTTSFNVKVLIDGIVLNTFNYTGINAGEKKTGNFTKSFSGTSPYGISILINPITGESNTSDNTKTITITPQSTCSIPPSKEEITAKFKIEKPSIEFGSYNGVMADGISVTGGDGCAIQNVIYTVSQNGNSKVYSNTGAFSFNVGGLPPDPGWMTIGTVSVSLKVTSTCGGEANAVPKTFQVISPASCVGSNSPPVVRVGWFQAYDGGSIVPESMFAVDERVWLRVIQKSAMIPGDHDEPYDPDGDPYFLTWDFPGSSSSWVRQLGTDYDLWDHEPNGWTYNFNANVLGTHSIKVTATDKCGNQSQTSATMSVVPPNPVPIITLPPKVVEGRLFTPDISCTNSYSPYKFRTISNCDWHGTKLPIYPAFGDYNIQLDVTDSAGLRSLDTAHSRLNVLEDLLPVAQLDYNDIGIRNVSMSFQDKSYSPDSDPISEHTVTLACDNNNNGSLADDTLINMTPDGNGNFTYTPTQVAKTCNIHIHLKEGLGLMKSTDKDFPFEVINQMPEVDFSAFGVQPEPANIMSVTPTANTLVNSATWAASSITRTSAPKLYNYNSGDNSISTKNMTNYEPYKSITSSNVVTKWFSTYKGYCHDCGNTGKLDGYYAAFNKENRIAKHLWKSAQNGDAIYFYNEDNPQMPYGSTHSAAPQINNNGGWGEPVIPKLNSAIKTEYNSDMIFQRQGGYNSYWQNSAYNEIITRISDILNFTKNDTNQLVTPAYTGTKTLTCGSAWSDSPTCPPPEPTTYPTMFTGPNPDITNAVSLMDSVDYWHDWDGYIVPRGTTQFSSPFNRDSGGNVYKNKCDYGTYDNYAHSCSLVKYNSGGVVMWEYTPTLASWTYNRTGISIDYFSDNESKMVIKYGAVRVVLNANTGTVAIDLVGGGNPADPHNNLIYYLGVFNNRIAYIKQTVESGYYTTVGKNGFWDLMFYDLGSGQTTTIDRVKTYQYLIYYWPDDGDITYRSPTPKATISSDGKLIIGNGETNILAYDMTTGVKEVDIPTGLAFSNFSDSGNGSNTYGIKSINLTEDGTIKVVYQGNADYGGTQSRYEWILSVKTDVNNITGNSSYGFLSNNDASLYNGDISMRTKFNYNTYSDSVTAGIGFRVQNNKNMYRVEMTPNLIKLTKIVNGISSTIMSKNYNSKLGVYTDIKAKVRANHIIVYAAGIPIIDTYDDTFAVAGSYGLYSESPYVELKDFNAMIYESSDTAVANQAIVNMPITYSTSYLDPENDPAIPNLALWKFTNMEPYKFLNAGDGASDPVGTNSYNGIVIQSPSPSISKVGVFKVEFQEPDDPAPAGFKYPSSVFAMFQKMSDPATHSILVHRRPIEQFTIAENADHTIQWTETGYDPDRWLSAANYSTEATGRNYQTTRGIFNNRYSYTTPSGVTQLGKLTRPTETGLYTVRAAVADEYGAWSDWVEQTINITIPLPNQLPAALLTFPNGTQASPSYVNTLTPTNTWNQTDPDPGTTFAAFQVVIKDELGNVVVDSGIKPQGTSSTTQEWITSQTLAQGQKYQVQVRVSDGIAWSPWSNVGWMITNRQPTAIMLEPNGTQASPTRFSTLRPTLKWNQTDPDPGTTFTYFQIQITNETNDTLIVDSGQYYQGSSSLIGSWTVNTDLPVGHKLRVRVRVFDGVIWSDYSPQTWLYINRPPIANFDWAPKPVWEGDEVQSTNTSTDPDGDALSYLWTFQGPDGVTKPFTTTNFMEKFSQPGNYKVTLTATDGFLTSTVVKTITAMPLTINSVVTYTDNWLIVHNQKGHQTQVNPKQFYSGEIFVVKSQSASASVDEVLAWIDTISLDGHTLYVFEKLKPQSSDTTLFRGELFDSQFQSLTEGLPLGAQTIHFQIRYSNGVVKKEDIPIEIIGNAQQSVGVHRVQ
ncbi:PKD domain-containing protein [Paenibacillus qinlingensis]|uniref:PKD domain-containing protein n=1 Tax=Paenibacillus qinlingensis TaxID=1837343 RepID=UPI001567BE8C|nr:PKD domain-containing protein [Paenibacillus qinlingensis]NQX61562.1 PKD domain-containing protein [Paenibacillus qinlingensis]